MSRAAEYVDNEGRTVRLIINPDQVTPAILADVEDCVSWFDGEPMGVEDFIDRLCRSYGQVGEDRYDIERLDSPAVKMIMRHARAVR